MEFLMLLLHQGRRLLPMGKMGQVICLLEWLLLLSSCITYTMGTGCRFPDFLQSSDEGMGNWTCKYGERTVLRIEVLGGQYLVFMNSNTTYRGPHRQTMWAERVLTKQRRCVKKVGVDKFIVEHVEPRPTYQCVQFIRRSPYVVQVKISRALKNWTNICQLNLSLDEFPWISLKGYRNAVTSCPFTGGLNFHNVTYISKSHAMLHQCPHTDPAVRVESDCVEHDGIHFQLGDDHCVKHRLKSSHFLCMANWIDEEVGDGFALLRNANGDRHFFCLRVKYKHGEGVQLFLYLDWVCYRANDFQTPAFKLPIATPYITFDRKEKRVISYPCRDDEQCSARGDCDNDHCLNVTSIPCEFSDEVIGNWQIQQANRDASTFEILKDGVDHPGLGQLQCVSFNDQAEARLRAILAANFQNGCFPRFLCMDFEMPNQSVMRYRMGDVLEWPLTLSDKSICHEDNFQVPPDISIPTDIYHPKPSMVALRSAGSESIPTMPCVLPGYIPRHNSFVSHDNRTGCIILRPDFAPSTVSISFFKDGLDETRLASRTPVLSVEKFRCVAALSYTSIVTLSSGGRKEFLCWVVVDRDTIVVIKTSACNEWTARRIVHGNKKYTPDMTYSLKLGVASKPVTETCARIYKEEHDAWCTGNDNTRVERQKFGDPDAASTMGCRDVCSKLFLYVLLSLIVCLISDYNRYVLAFTRVIR